MKRAIYRSKFGLKFFIAYFISPWYTQRVYQVFFAMRLLERILRVFKKDNFNFNHPVFISNVINAHNIHF